MSRDGFLFGSDELGCDLLTRILLAARISLSTALIVVVCSVIIGVLLDVTADYYRGFFEDLIMRTVDLAMSFPSLLLAIVIIYIASPEVDKVILVLICARWMLYTRVARAETLRLSQFQYVDAARATGCSHWRIIQRHLLPNLVSVIFTLAVLELSGVILTEAGLSFISMEMKPPTASWGLLIAQGKKYLSTAWWLAFFPGMAVFLTTMAFGLIANWLSVALDPVKRWRLHG